LTFVFASYDRVDVKWKFVFVPEDFGREGIEDVLEFFAGEAEGGCGDGVELPED
jgi:hypothetical protein